MRFRRIIVFLNVKEYNMYICCDGNIEGRKVEMKSGIVHDPYNILYSLTRSTQWPVQCASFSALFIADLSNRHDTQRGMNSTIKFRHIYSSHGSTLMRQPHEQSIQLRLHHLFSFVFFKIALLLRSSHISSKSKYSKIVLFDATIFSVSWGSLLQTT